MKVITIVSILVLSFLLAILGCFGFNSLVALKQARMTEDLCNAAGNYLEVGSLREAFETLQSGLARAGLTDACVSLIDNGRSYAPECADPLATYRTVVCRAEGNKGVRAEIHTPITPLFSWRLGQIWLGLFAMLLFMTLAIQRLVKWLTLQVVKEVREHVFKIRDSTATTSIIGRGITWVSEKTGLTAEIIRRTKAMQSQLEEQQRHVAEETALRIRGEIKTENARSYIEKVATIRHDMRTPLSALESIQEAVAHDDLLRSTIISTIRKIQAMMDDIEKIDRGQKTARLTIAEIVAEECIAGLRRKFLVGKDVKLELEYRHDRLSPVKVVPDEFRRALDNLLENAFDAVSRGGQIIVRVVSDESRCEIMVEDNGCGVAAVARTNLFSKNGTFGKIGGSGLGLYQVKESVVSWDGEVDYEALNPGSRFIISLPLVQAGVVFVGFGSVGPFTVIDDDPSLARSLSKAGFEIAGTAFDSAEGRRMISAWAINSTVLVDQQLGNGDLGTDLVAIVPNRDRVLLCTNDYDNPDVISRARHLGLKILPKPLCLLAAVSRPNLTLAISQ